MYKNIIISLLMVLGLAACSDDLEFKSGSVIATDGTVELTFSVPELEKVATRAEIGDEPFNCISTYL